MNNILNRKNLFTTQSITLLIIIAAILVVVNLISANHFGRLDLTNDKQYSISGATKNTIKNLDDLLTIKVYFSKQLPPDLAQSSQYIRDILAEYKAYSSKVKIELIDPAKDEATKNEVLSLGIPELEMQVLEKDQYKVQKGFFGIAFFYGDKKEIIPMVQDIQNLEYEVTSIVKRLTSESLQTIGFLSGHDEHGIYDLSGTSNAGTTTSDYATIKKELDKNYNVVSVDLAKEKAMQNISTLIIAGPKKSLTDDELYQIDQFLMNGGKVVFLVDEVLIGEGLQAQPIQSGLEKILAKYGVKINQDLIIDSSNENVGFTSGYMQFFMPYPFWPKLIKANFDQSNPIMSRLQSLSLSWASSIFLEKQNNIEYNFLAQTTKNAGSLSQPFDLNPQQEFKADKRSQYSMIVLAKGNFTSAFKDEKVSADSKIDQATKESQILVMADSDFITDNNLKRFPDNGVFFLNAVDYLTVGSELISIRSKNISERPIQQLDDEAKMIVKTINIIILPGLVIILGLVRYYKRKKK
jgi:gliding-associated putative ABC transporter substrate-binding component GldG